MVPEHGVHAGGADEVDDLVRHAVLVDRVAGEEDLVDDGPHLVERGLERGDIAVRVGGDADLHLTARSCGARAARRAS